MKRNAKYLRRKGKHGTLIPVLCVFAAALMLLIGCMLHMIRKNSADPTEIPAQTLPAQPLPAETAIETTAQRPTTEAPTETTQPPETAPPQLLGDMAKLYQDNPDTVGWLKIDGTKIDYPIMHTPADPEKYLHMDFDGNYNFGGLPFIDYQCSLEPESDNLLIYGHNMNNGTMFRDLMRYQEVSFWKDHPVIQFSTLYERRQYEILAAFYDRVYFTYEDCFKFYQFIDAADQAEFDSAIANFKEKSLYDTGVTAVYGDSLITLVTCAYHVDNGRFVVVAREVQ